jgi:hypothetical protein
MAVLFILLAGYWLESASQPKPWPVFLVMTAVIAVIIWQAYVNRIPGILPPLLLGYLLLFLRHRYAYSGERRRRWSGVILAIFLVGVLAYMVSHLPGHMLIFAFFLVAAVIVVLNNQFYLFLAAQQGSFFAVAAVPFHLLYHLYNGISFTVGLLRFTWRNLWRKKPAMEPVRRPDAR